MCDVDGCHKPSHCRGWCKTHYERWRTSGTTDRRPTPTPRERFDRSYRVDTDGCWRWTGEITHNGYGRLLLSSSGNRHVRMQAHKWIARQVFGEFGDDMQVDHLCKTRSCVNPAHLEVVTAKENNRRSGSPSAGKARQTHCIRGHDFADPAILYVTPDGRRQCRPCRGMSVKKWQQRAA